LISSAAPGSLRKKYAGILHPPNMVRLPISSTTSGDHRKPVLEADPITPGSQEENLCSCGRGAVRDVVGIDDGVVSGW